jgi:fructuronate reductase
MIPLVFAGWLRYLLGVDDKGNHMDLSPDPRMEELAGLLGGIRPGQHPVDEKGIDTILRDQSIFSIDLFSCGMATKVKGMFAEMLEGPGAVRRTLQKYCS